MGVQIDVFGSYVSRDVMRYMAPESYTLNRCIGGVPISTLFEKPLQIDKNKLETANISQYDKRMMMIQLNRNAPLLLKKSDSSVLLIDLASEYMNRIIFNNTDNTMVAYPDIMDGYLEDFFSGLDTEFTKTSLLDIDMKKAEKKYRHFAQSIVKSDENPMGYSEENIIVIEAYYSPYFVDNKYGKVNWYSAKYRIKEMNAALKNLYGILYKYIPGCRIIKMPLYTMCTQNHIRGFGPLFYTDETYQYMADCVEVLCGISKKNSVENLYEQASLDNKLKARLMKCAEVYSIAGMKKEIAQLTAQVKALKKQVEDLKKEKQ